MADALSRIELSGLHASRALLDGLSLVLELANLSNPAALPDPSTILREQISAEEEKRNTEDKALLDEILAATSSQSDAPSRYDHSSDEEPGWRSNSPYTTVDTESLDDDEGSLENASFMAVESAQRCDFPENELSDESIFTLRQVLDALQGVDSNYPQEHASDVQLIQNLRLDTVYLLGSHNDIFQAAGRFLQQQLGEFRTSLASLEERVINQEMNEFDFKLKVSRIVSPFRALPCTLHSEFSDSSALLDAVWTRFHVVTNSPTDSSSLCRGFLLSMIDAYFSELDDALSGITGELQLSAAPNFLLPFTKQWQTVYDTITFCGAPLQVSFIPLQQRPVDDIVVLLHQCTMERSVCAQRELQSFLWAEHNIQQHLDALSSVYCTHMGRFAISALSYTEQQQHQHLSSSMIKHDGVLLSQLLREEYADDIHDVTCLSAHISQMGKVILSYRLPPPLSQLIDLNTFHHVYNLLYEAYGIWHNQRNRVHQRRLHPPHRERLTTDINATVMYVSQLQNNFHKALSECQASLIAAASLQTIREAFQVLAQYSRDLPTLQPVAVDA